MDIQILIGHLTDTTVNLWIKYSNGGSIFCKYGGNIFYQNLKQYNNNTTVFHIKELEPDTKYTFEIGQDSNIKIVVVKTLPANTYSKKCYIGLASCQYPSPHKSDKIFKAFINVLDNKQMEITPVVFHVGDQVYADQLNRKIPFRRADTNAEFTKLYEDKFNGKYFSEFCSKYSSLMTLDDHEIEDNWCMDRLKGNSILSSNPRDLFTVAMRSYKIYQASHSPNYVGCNQKLDNSRFWYTANIGVYNFFVLDTRTERYNENGNLLGDPNIKTSQFNMLCEWLKAQDINTPKFIVSSVIFAPINTSDLKDKVFQKTGISEKSDNWNGYSTRNQLLKFIADNNINKVVFLSGDIHNSLAISMKLTYKEKEIKLYQIISSPLFWPFPFADGDLSNYVLNSDDLVIKKKSLFSNSKKIDIVIDNKWKYSYECHLDSYTQLNNFAILEFNSDMLHVNWYGIDESILASHTIIF